MKKKVLFSSILTIALCLTLIAGSTFALFTADEEFTIQATSAKVDFTATIDEASMVLWSIGDKQGDETGEVATVFENGGEAEFIDLQGKRALHLTRITPGDKVTFDVVLKNESNVDIKYIVTWTATGGADLSSAIQVSVAEGQRDATAYNMWKTTEATEKTLTVTVELPKEVGNECQEESTTIDFTVFAVQGNG